MRKKHLVLVAVVMAFSLVLSGCFSLRTFYWSRKSTTAGGSINAVLNLRPYNADADSSGYPFILIALGSTDPLSFGSLRVWDDDANFDGPKTMTKDNTLRNYVINNRLCTASGINASDVTGVTWTAFRAPDSVAYAANSETKNAQVKFRINVGSGASAGNVYSVLFFSGEWEDTSGEGTPGGGDTFTCTGVVGSSFPIVP